MIYWFTVRILHDYCRRNKIHPQSNDDEESAQSADDHESNQKNECDCKKIQLKTEELEVGIAEINANNSKLEAGIKASNSKMETDIKASNSKLEAEIKASNAEIKASNSKLEAEIKASNDEIKGLLEDLLRGRSSK